ncbi:MAG: hypothetical protein WBG20_07080, partial [Candidatus Deferrimicrobiaceae bacterium]
MTRPARRMVVVFILFARARDLTLTPALLAIRHKVSPLRTRTLCPRRYLSFTRMCASLSLSGDTLFPGTASSPEKPATGMIRLEIRGRELRLIPFISFRVDTGVWYFSAREASVSFFRILCR